MSGLMQALLVPNGFIFDLILVSPFNCQKFTSVDQDYKRNRF
jgi:hypothetical protein